MAQPTNAYSTYQQVGIREDLLDTISNISPEETPFQSLVGRGSAKNTYHEWQTDSLDSVDKSNAAIEGDDPTLQASTPTKRLGNYTQISNKTAVVTGSAERVDKAGRTREMAYQMAKRSKELKRDLEAILLSGQAAVAGDDSTPRKTAGVQAFIYGDNRLANGGSAADPVYSSGTPGVGYPTTAAVAGTPRVLTESLLKDVLENVWAAGGNPRYIFTSSKHKKVISGFTGIATQYKNVPGTQQGTIIAAADVYVSDFGTVTIVPDRFHPDDSILALDPDMVSIDYLRPYTQFPLAKTGDSEKRELLVEYALRVNNPQGIGVVVDLS